MRRLFSWPGGIRLPRPNSTVITTPPATLPLPAQLVLALQDSQPCVSPGQQVLKYQRLADADSEFGLALHAPTSGRIVAIRQQAQALPGMPQASSLILEADGCDTALPLQPVPPAMLTRLTLAWQLQEMGVCGERGPLLPLDWAAQQHSLPLLIINAVEDEPGLAARTALLGQQPEAVAAAIAMLEQVLQPTRIVIAIHQQQHAAYQALHAAVAGRGWQTEIISSPYPAADEASLCTLLARPEEADHSLCLPVDAVAAAGAAILHGQPCISRLVSVGGKLPRPGNVLALLGTPLSHVMAFAGAAASQDIGHGGSLRAYTLPAAQADVLGLHWHSNCLLAGDGAAASTQDCIRCGDCARSCPSQLQPQELYWHCSRQDMPQALDWGLQDCSLCGLCSAVCPSQLPLLEQFRHSALQHQAGQLQQQAADQARQRHRFRQFRLERDKQEKAQRLAERAAEQAAKREQAASAAAPTSKAAPDSADKQAAIAAAMARAAQRNSQHQEKQSASQSDTSQPDARAAAIAASRQAAIDAAMARAAARKAAQDAAKASNTEVDGSPASAPDSDKQALIAAAMQRAAAQKAAQASTPSAGVDADKQALIAAAMQRAAAQKAAQASAPSAGVDADKQALIAAAMQRAAVQKAAQASAPSTGVDADKQALIAAAMQRAAAQKAAQAAARQDGTPPPEQANGPENP